MEVRASEEKGLFDVGRWLQTLGSKIFKTEEEQAADQAAHATEREQAALRLQSVWRGRGVRRHMTKASAAPRLSKGHTRTGSSTSTLKKRPNMMDSRIASRKELQVLPMTPGGPPVRASLSFATPTKAGAAPVRPALSFPAACPTSAREDQEPSATGAAPVETTDESGKGVVKRPSFKKGLASRLSFKRLVSRFSFRRPSSFPLSNRESARKAELRPAKSDILPAVETWSIGIRLRARRTAAN